MKTLILIILFFAAVVVNAQTKAPLALRMDLVTWVKFEPKDYLAGGKVGTLDITVKNYNVYQDGTKQYYVEIPKRKGNSNNVMITRVYLGYKHGGIQEYQGNTVFFNKDTTECWMWTVDKYGSIFKMDLPDYFTKDARIIKTP